MPTRLALARCALLALLATAATAAPAKAQDAPADLHWFKGNTHTHTINSDGDSSPDDVVKWYRTHGYQFVVLTDHNVLYSVDALNALHGLDERFLVIRGEEVTDRFGDHSIHINALNPARLVEPQGGASVVDVMQRNVDEIRAAEGIPHISHPNFRCVDDAGHPREHVEQVSRAVHRARRSRAGRADGEPGDLSDSRR